MSHFARMQALVDESETKSAVKPSAETAKGAGGGFEGGSKITLLTGDDLLRDIEASAAAESEAWLQQSLAEIAKQRKKVCVLSVDKQKYEVLRNWVKQMADRRFSVKFRTGDNQLIGV